MAIFFTAQGAGWGKAIPGTIRLPAVLLFLAFMLVACGGGGGGGTSKPLPSVTTLNATLVTDNGAMLNGIVNPNGLATTAWFEWGTDPGLATFNSTSAQALDNTTTGQPVQATLSGLGYGTTYYFRAAASNIEGTGRGAIGNFRTPNPAPTAATSGADQILTDGARLNGTVNPNGVATNAWFEWGTDPSLSTFTSTAVQSLGNETTTLAISSTLAPLNPGTTYYFRLKATSASGDSSGSILPFVTLIPPTAATLAASSITASSALLNGTVNPNGVATNAWFEWGTSPSLSTFDNTAVQILGSGTSGQLIAAPLTNLIPGTTYYFRVKASSAAGESTGSIVSFPTLLLPSVTTQNVSSIALTNNDTQGQATFHGDVNPNGSSTEAWFEWGIDPSLVSYTATGHQFIGTTTQSISATVSALIPWRIHYYRAVALSTAGGPIRGTIRSFPAGEKYVAVGDSITLGSGDNVPADDTSLDGRNSGGGYEPILNNLLTAIRGYPHTVLNNGLSGEISSDGAVRITSVISNNNNLNAKYFLVMYGTNDADILVDTPSGLGLNPGDPGYSGSYKDNMQTIISAVLYAGKIPYLAKVPYTTDPNRDIVKIQEYNQVIIELLFDNPIMVIPPDFYAWFQSHQGELADGTHPNGTGYQSMADLWYTALTQ